MPRWLRSLAAVSLIYVGARCLDVPTASARMFGVVALAWLAVQIIEALVGRLRRSPSN